MKISPSEALLSPLTNTGPATSSVAAGDAVPIPTLPSAAMTKGEASASPVSSLTRKEFAAPRLVIMNGVAVEVASVAAFRTEEWPVAVLAVFSVKVKASLSAVVSCQFHVCA